MSTFAKHQGRPIPWKIYIAHTLSTWGDNMWWFAGGLYMMQLAPGSLRLTALYGLVIATSVICFGASVGNWIDKTNRITAARTFLAIQNLCVSIAALMVSCFLWIYSSNSESDDIPEVAAATNRQDNIQTEYPSPTNDNITTEQMVFDHSNSESAGIAKHATIVGVIIFSSIARLASSGTVIILQRDWIVVIAEDDTDYLAKMNSILRTIELATYMLAPVVVGQLFYFIGYIWTGGFIAVWNGISVVCEYTLLNGIYKRYPKLAEKIRDTKQGTNIDEESGSEERSHLRTEDNGKCRHEENDGMNISCWSKMVPDSLTESIHGWSTYFHHPVRNAGLGLALLYMTVLGFDNITYGYAILQKVPEAVLGGIVAVSAMVGVMGSNAYPILRRRLGLERTGLLGMFLLVSTSSLSVVSIFLPGSPFMNKVYNIETSDRPSKASLQMMKYGDIFDHSNFTDEKLEADQSSSMAHITVLMIGIIVARFGLWIVDLTITQILQERVEEEHRGVVNGVQDSLNNTLDLLKCVLVILLPGADDFGYLIILSYLSISTGWIFYAGFSRQQRGHLFHFCRLIPNNNKSELAHLPFFPEPKNEQTNECYEENKRLQDQVEARREDEEFISPVKLEHIIDCTREVQINQQVEPMDL